jgi:hypothetical protein
MTLPTSSVLAGIVFAGVFAGSGLVGAAHADTLDASGLEAYFANWDQRVAAARASQPEWSSPIVTTTGMLEERVRVDTSFQRSGNGTSTTNLDGGKGVDLIITDSDELQIAADPYVIRSANEAGKNNLEGFNDWPVLRLKHRLLSSPASEDNYVVSVWLQGQVPTGIGKLTNHAFTLLPTLGAGKGWGDFDIQGTIGGVIPTAHEDKLGDQVTGNLALQYHLLRVFWPQIEVNWTYYPDGPRGGKNQVYLTPGVVIGRLPITDRLRVTIGVGYQSAVAPTYRASPQTPAYNSAWIISTRLNF